MQYQGYRPKTPTPKKRRRRLSSRARKTVLVLVIFIALVTLLSFGLSALFSSGNSELLSQYRQSKDVFLENIYIDGIALGGMTYNDAFDVVVNRAQTWENSWSLEIACNGFVYSTLNYATAGIRLDYEQLDTLLQQAWQLGHNGGFDAYQQDVTSLAETPFEGYASVLSESNDQLDYILGVIADNVYRAPESAALLAFDASNPSDPFVFSSGTAGQQIDVSAVKEEILRLAAVGQSGRYDIPIQTIAPDKTVELLREDFSLLAESSTAIDRSSTEERNANISLALSSINGVVLKNGESFSFNKLVGKRSLDNGFQTALGYVSGALTEVVGGGVCQASTTVYSAALCAGMTITKRTPHSMPVSYISLGQDATVNDMRGHEIDLKFDNKTGSTVYITAGLETNAAGRLHCVVRFWGNALANDGYYKLQSTEIETLPIPEDEIRKDKEARYVVYDNQKYQLSKGVEGHVVETFLQLYEKGELISETLISRDTYKAKAAVYYVGVTPRN